MEVSPTHPPNKDTSLFWVKTVVHILRETVRKAISDIVRKRKGRFSSVTTSLSRKRFTQIKENLGYSSLFIM